VVVAFVFQHLECTVTEICSCAYCVTFHCIVGQEDFSTYPDMAAYHSIAVTLGQAGHLTELLGLIEALQVRPKRDSIKGTRRRYDWNGLLYPDIVVYNAVCYRVPLCIFRYPLSGEFGTVCALS